jgi:hypothetical protein
MRAKKMPERKVALLLRIQQGLKDRLTDLAFVKNDPKKKRGAEAPQSSDRGVLLSRLR